MGWIFWAAVLAAGTWTGGACAAASVVAYPRPVGDARSASIVAVTAGGVPVETVHTSMNVGYAHFAFSGAVDVSLRAREPITTFDISPHRAGIEARAEGDTLSFRLTRPQKLHIRINRLPRFFLFADAPEVDAPELGQAGVYNLADFGVRSSLDRIVTRAFQAAIDQVAGEGGVLYVPPGSYRTGQLTLRSGMTLYLPAGAAIRGTARLEDYPRGEFGTQQMYLLDCDRVAIRGRGVIDGQGRALRLAAENDSAARMKLFRAVRAANCELEGVVLRDSGTWTVHLAESRDLRFSNFKLIGNTPMDDPAFPDGTNTDGFDPDNSSRITIEDGFISCGDDAIAVKLRSGTLRDMEDILFQNNVVWTVKSALKIGTEVCDRRLSNVVFKGNDIVHADRGIVVYCYRGATIAGSKWLDNYFEVIDDNNKRMNIELRIRDVAGRGRIERVLIKDNVFERHSPNASLLRGLDEAHAIEGVRIENLTIAGRRCEAAASARIEIGEHVRDVVVE